MAAGRRGPFRRRAQRRAPHTFSVGSPGRAESSWSLVSSAARLDTTDRREAKVQRMLRQGWQSDAWNYRDSIGELRYASEFLANCTARMRIYPALYPPGGESDDPVALDKLSAADVPPAIVEALQSACAQALIDLGNGRNAIAGLLHKISTNKTIAGEWYLLGRSDPQTGRDTWSARSVDELVVYDDRWHLREIPDDRQNGVIPWIELEPQQTVISRVWTPHPRFELLADSPMKAMLDDCEALMILRRGIRATGRSRLARSGILAIPDGFSIKVPIDDNEDPEADPFMSALGQAMMDPIVDEGVASAVVPIVVRGPGEQIGQIKWFSVAGQFDAQASQHREELLGVIATSLDLPKEVIMGLADLNHWTAWQVDDGTFKYHVRPHVVACFDDLSGAFLRPYLADAGIPDQWVQRTVFWYDPVELVSHPDKTGDAKDLYDRHALSAEALARTAGFGEEDMPTPEETVIRMLQNMRNPPANLVMAAVHQMFPQLTIPPIETSGTVPGVKPSGVDTGEELLAPAGGPGPASTAGIPPVAVDAAPPAQDDTVATPGPAGSDRPGPGITAAASEANTGVMIALYPPSELAARWALPGGEAPDELHVTLAFLGQAADLADPDALRSAVQAWAAKTAPIAGEISGVGLFTAGEDPVTYLSPDLPSLPTARQALIDALAAAGIEHSTEHGFTPHITLDYADRVGDVDAAVGGTPLTFAAAAVVIGDDRTDCPFAQSLTAAGRREASARLSRRLQAIDAELRARLQTAANAALLRALERAGARLRTKVARDETLRTKIAHRSNERVGALLGPEIVAAAGLSPQQLIEGDWSALRAQFFDWTAAAQAQAIQAALRIGGLQGDSGAAANAQAAMAAGREAAWELLSGALTGLGQHLLYNPDPNAGPGEWGDLNPSTLVPAGTIRAALAVAGGASPAAVSVDERTGAAALLEPVGQIGTGSTIGDLIAGAGGQVQGYEWVHGPSLHPFEGHEDLDGVQFARFDDEQLANDSDWPDNAYYMPGDHDGCLCDFMPMWTTPDASAV